MVNSDIFLDGQDNIAAIFFLLGEGQLRVNGENEKIVVSMEYGQMAGVPWFCYYRNNVLISKWNGAHIEGVEFKKGEDQ